MLLKVCFMEAGRVETGSKQTVKQTSLSDIAFTVQI